MIPPLFGKQEVGIWWVQKRFPLYEACDQISDSCWEKCDEKCAYMFNVYKNQLSQQTVSRNLTGPKMLPTIWYTYMTLVTKYQISAINSYWEKCDEKYLGRTNRGKTVYPPPPSGSGGIIKPLCNKYFYYIEQFLKCLLYIAWYNIIWKKKF